jgi:hypothetical protein
MAPASRLIRTWSDDVKASKVRGRKPAQYNDKLRLPQTLKSECKTSKERECYRCMFWVLQTVACGKGKNQTNLHNQNSATMKLHLKRVSFMERGS